jgi:hypothetical protein
MDCAGRPVEILFFFIDSAGECHLHRKGALLQVKLNIFFLFFIESF